MNATVQDMLKQQAQQVRKETLKEVANQISNQATMYDKLLDNPTGKEIDMLTKGWKSRKIDLLRLSLHSKAEILWWEAGELAVEIIRINTMRKK